MPQPPPAAPQSIGGVLDSGFRLFRLCLGGTFLLATASGAVYAAFTRSLQTAGASPGAILNAILLVMVGMVMMTAFYGAVIARVDAADKPGQLALADTLAKGWRRTPALLLTGVLYTLLVVSGSVLLLVPGVVLAVGLGFCFYAAVLEATGPIASLQYSWRLVRGHWWRTAALFLIITVVAGVLYLVGATVVAVFHTALGGGLPGDGTMPVYIEFVAVPLLTGVLVPLVYALFIAAYRDLKSRREGADLAYRIAAAEA